MNAIEKLKHSLEEFILTTIEQRVEKPILSAREAAQFLGVSRSYIAKKQNIEFIERVHYYKKDGKIFFVKDALLDWLKQKDEDGEHNQKQRLSVSKYLHKQKEEAHTATA